MKALDIKLMRLCRNDMCSVLLENVFENNLLILISNGKNFVYTERIKIREQLSI